jgi:hypothetical protein
MKVLHPPTENLSEVFGVRLVLETGHKVVGVPEQIRFAPTLSSNPALEPDIQDIMEVDIGQERGNNRSLRRTLLARLRQPVFHDAGLEHADDQAKDSPVLYPLLEKLQQPFVIHVIEEASNVGFDDYVYSLLLDGPPYGVKAMMGVAPGSVTVATIVKQRLEQRFQHAFRGQFHYLVLEAADPQRVSWSSEFCATSRFL